MTLTAVIRLQPATPAKGKGRKSNQTPLPHFTATLNDFFLKSTGQMVQACTLQDLQDNKDFYPTILPIQNVDDNGNANAQGKFWFIPSCLSDCNPYNKNPQDLEFFGSVLEVEQGKAYITQAFQDLIANHFDKDEYSFHFVDDLTHIHYKCRIKGVREIQYKGGQNLQISLTTVESAFLLADETASNPNTITHKDFKRCSRQSLQFAIPKNALAYPAVCEFQNTTNAKSPENLKITGLVLDEATIKTMLAVSKDFFKSRVECGYLDNAKANHIENLIAQINARSTTETVSEVSKPKQSNSKSSKKDKSK